MSKTIEERERVVVRFAGDSGDGMQLAGSRFTDATAVLGNDLATLPNFPAEIRAPAGTLAGVSAFQIHFASRDILTPGDAPNVLVAMNPAALKSNLSEIDRGATIIVNEDAFSKRNLEKAGYDSNPLEDGSLEGYRVHRIPMTALTTRAVEEVDDASTRDAGRAKNLFALGVLSWLYGRPTDVTERWIEQKFKSKPPVMKANLAAFNAGWSFGETTELLDVQYRVKPVTGVPPGTYRNVNGTSALALGLVAASVRSRLPLLLASYPITPASELLHELSRHAGFGVRTIQAEDEIAAAGMALGAAFGGRLGVTATSGPGMDLKAETVGLAVALELPMIVIDVQRAGPSTGMPTKTEQSDLLMALYGRHGESPLPVIAPSTPAGCFEVGFEAVQIAVRYRTPVIILSDTFLASSSEPWRIPEVADLPADRPRVRDGRGRGGWGFRAVRARRPAGTAMGGARDAGAAAPDRRPREGRPDRQHLVRRRQSRADDEIEGGEDRGNRGRAARARGRPRGRREAAGARMGLERGRDPRRRQRRARGRAQGRLRPPASPQPAARQHRRGAAGLRPRARARDELRPARADPAGPSTWWMSSRLTKVQGQPLFAGEIEMAIEERQ